MFKKTPFHLSARKMSSKQTQRYTTKSEDWTERVFTRPKYLRRVARMVASRMDDDDCFVDCSCGTGELGLALANLGKKVIMFDVDDRFVFEEATPFFIKKSWFDVTANDFPPAKNYIMGFNPPYGYRGKLARDFISHCLTFGLGKRCPLLVFLVPYLRGWCPQNYVEEGHQTEKSKDIFYYPGKKKKIIPDFYGVILTVLKWTGCPPPPAAALEDLPEGWSVSSHPQTRHRLPYSVVFDLDCESGPGRFILLKKSGLDAGQACRYWDPIRKKFIFLNKNGERKIESQTTTFSSTQYSDIVVPPKYAHDGRLHVMKFLRRYLFNVRERQGRKQGVSVQEVIEAVFAFVKRENQCEQK